MANYNYAVKVYKSLLGRSTHDVYSNTYNIQSSSVLGADSLDDTMQQIVAAERAATYDAVSFLRVTMLELMQTPTQQGQGTFASRVLSGTGERTLGSAKLLNENTVVAVSRETTTGRSGKLFYRFLLADTDVNSSDTVGMTLTSSAISTLNSTLIASLNAALADGTYVMPNRPLNALDYNREISRFRLAGVETRKAHVNRTSVDSLMGRAAQRKINVLTHSIRAMLAGAEFSATNPAFQGKIIAASDEIKDILQALSPDVAQKISLDAVLRGIPGGPAV